MTWTATEGSHIFAQWVIGPMLQASGTGYTGLDSDAINFALFGNTGTPDNDAAVGLTGYNTGAWVTGNEVSTGTEWVAGGRALASKTFTTPVADVVMFDAADLVGASTVTLAGVYGGLAYDNTITAGTVSKQGTSYHYFGGVQGVTAGTFSVIFNVNGLQRYTL